MIQIHKFSDEIVDITFKEISLKDLRDREEMLWDTIPEKDYEFQIVAEELFDDYCCTRHFKEPATLLYLECIKVKPVAPKGSGSERLKSFLTRLVKNDSIVCLYASPICQKRNLTYSDAEMDIHLPKLLSVYEKLGFISSTENRQVMYYYV